jgi:hypothetical protein
MSSLDPIDPGAWAAAASTALEAVAATALQRPVVILGSVPPPATIAVGAYVPVLAASGSLQIGVVADEASCISLARSLLQMSPADDALSPADVADAIGEIANMVAGLAKAAMSSRIGLVALGLPMVINGSVTPRDSIALDCIGARLDTETLTIVIVRPLSAASDHQGKT